MFVGKWKLRLIDRISIGVLALAAAYKLTRMKSAFTVENTVAMRARDGATYRVHPAHRDPRGAADRLAMMNERLVALMRVLRQKYARDPEACRRYPRRCAAVRNLLRRYDANKLAENSPLDPSGDTSYVINKGKLLALCLRERPAGGGCADGSCAVDVDFLGLDLLTFVSIHELTHMAIDALDHPKEFWQTFAWLLKEAEAARILAPARYDLRPAMYCGLKVDYTPAYDPNITLIE
jgi:hypothetical protein